MSKWLVTVKVQAMYEGVVEAKSPKEAERKAKENYEDLYQIDKEVETDGAIPSGGDVQIE